jgi:DNA-binding response OmpR family regulator
MFRDRVKRSPVYADAMSEEAVGGAHALAKLLQWPCDGVLLDRNLPDLDAQEVADQIRKQYPEMQVELVDPGMMAKEETKVEGACAATGEEGEAAAQAGTTEEVAAGDAVVSEGTEIEGSEWQLESHQHSEAAREVEPLPGMIGSSRAMEQVYRLMTNVVDVYINYLRRKVDSGYERSLIRTVRGVGYQIGGTATAARSAAASSSSSSVTVA